ncbi:hypothetical protein BBJ28_00015598 [Nothophytophthora sp. Chile5]|nr:hypothetical protein BBJ28_00015598 [Nothophytophthora sp. Chile5]
MENYHILERIGEGSFGKVYRGRRKFSGHIVALKFVTKQGKSARDLENLRQEINILRPLNHCNIIAMLDSFETEGEFCMVIEYAQGELFQVLEDEHTLPEPEIRKIAIQLIQALHVLHSNRIIHRDMKPQNILIGSKQQIKLCDFGFARAISHDTSLLRSIKGTPLYMAPELVQEQPYNYTVDLWSLGVILYELAVGRPPFYTDRIVTLIQMIVREPVNYPSTMSPDFQSFLKGLLNKDPAQRLTWPEILQHPFVVETPEQLEARLQLERQVRVLPRFFNENAVHPSSGGHSEKKVKPSVERLRSCDEWKICDPETGRQLSNIEALGLADRNTPRESSTKKENNGRASSPVHAVATDEFQRVWDQICKELALEQVDAKLVEDPLVIRAVGLLSRIPSQDVSSDIVSATHSLLNLQYRSLGIILKHLDHLTRVDRLIQIKDSMHLFLGALVDTDAEFQAGGDTVSDTVYQVVRCCMMFTTVINAIEIDNELVKELNYREFCRSDIKAIMAVLTCKERRAVASQSKALKWLGSMIDRSQKLTMLLEVVHSSGVIQTLCETLQSSASSRSPGGRISKDGRDLGLYSVFALAAFVQPDGRSWGPLHPFPVMTLVRDDMLPIGSSTLRDVKHLYKLRVKVHSEVGSQLLKNGIGELIALLRDELNERILQRSSRGGGSKSGNNDVEDDEGEEDADQSTTCCILKLLLHVCRSSGPLSKKLMTPTVQLHDDHSADIISIVLWGVSCGALHQIEKYFAIEFLSVILRRGILTKRQVWHSAQTLFPLLQHERNVALLSALAMFFADVIESGNIDETALSREGQLSALASQDAELWNLVVHGVLTSSSSNAMFRLFRNAATDADDGDYAMSDSAQMLTSYNIRAQGLLDSGIVFFLRVAAKAVKEPSDPELDENDHTKNSHLPNAMKVFIAVFEQAFVWEVLSDMMATSGGDLLSPWGLFCFLKLMRTVREVKCSEPQVEIALNERLLSLLVKLLDLKHIEYLFHWPEVVGGGSNAVKALVHATVKVLGIPFMHNVSEEWLVDTQEILYDAKCVQHLLGVLRFVFSTKELQLEASVLELPISFLSRLVTSSTHFGLQFVEAEGMMVVKECAMLRSSCSPSLTIDTLSIVSQLARSSLENCECILQADLLPEFYELMQHPEAMVRAKTLNCIGNLCRHSTLFYRRFIAPLSGSSSSTILAGVIRGLSDQDNYVRRFACFALGNAAFHNDDLYDELRPAIPFLIQNLHNHEEKTRSNAGGALGNLIRNSDELCGDLCAHQAPWELFELAMTDTSTASRRIVLFSLGNFCVYPQCYNSIVEAEPGFIGELERLYDEVVADEVSRRNICRILSKVEALNREASGVYGDSPGLVTKDCTAKCPKGTYNDKVGARSILECKICPAGVYGSSPGLTTSECSGPCPNGKYSVTPGQQTISECLDCPAFYRGPQGYRGNNISMANGGGYPCDRFLYGKTTLNGRDQNTDQWVASYLAGIRNPNNQINDNLTP